MPDYFYHTLRGMPIKGMEVYENSGVQSTEYKEPFR